jgi:hypothetical protein
MNRSISPPISIRRGTDAQGGRQVEHLLKSAATAGLRYRLFDSLHLGLLQETRDYVRATREQFITARETTRIGVGRRNAESVAMCLALRPTREPLVSA